MALTTQDREMVELIAREVAHEVGDKLAAAQTTAVRQMLELHQGTCPHGRRLLEGKWFLAGAALVVLLLTAGGSVVGQIMMKLLTAP